MNEEWNFFVLVLNVCFIGYFHGSVAPEMAMALRHGAVEFESGLPK
jgi:hypothetical protein